MPENNTPLRFGVLLDVTTIKKWQYDCIEQLHTSEFANLVSFYVNKGEKTYGKTKNSIGFRFFDRSIRHKGPLALIDIAKQFDGIPQRSIKTYQKGYSTYIKEDDLELIKQDKPDFMLRFGFGILKGPVLQLPTYGVWSFHHGNPELFRGGPAGFWEIYHHQDTTGAILQQLNEKLDAGKILRSGNFRTVKHSYNESFYHLLESTTRWPLLVATDLVLNQQFKTKTLPKKGPIYKVPSTLHVFIFLLKLLKNRLSLYHKLLFRAEMWKVGIVHQKIQTVVDGNIKNVDWITSNNKSSYWADPFAFSDTEFLVEEYNYIKAKGNIQKVDLSGKATPFLEKETHLSYPYTIQLENTKYLLPESNKSGALELLAYRNEKVTSYEILKGGWVDPSLYFYNNKWWLFCTSGHAPNEDLYLFFSDDIKGKYTSHPLNPVVQDLEKARPGGTLFENNNTLYRPSQKCSTVYGECIQLNKITCLSTTDYQEEWVKSIDAKHLNKNLKGLHTLSAFGEKTLIDVKTTGFNFSNFFMQLTNKLKK